MTDIEGIGVDISFYLVHHGDVKFFALFIYIS